jgi:hypothetical protein
MKRIAWFNIAIHLMGLACAAVIFPRGATFTPLPERMAYLAPRPWEWVAGWAVWIGCALLMVRFTWAVNRRFQSHSFLAGGAFFVSLWAAGFDITADLRFILVLPDAAASLADPETTFREAERRTTFISLCIANTLYAISTLMMSLGLRRQFKLLPSTMPVALGVFVFGLMLSTAGLTQNPWHAAVFTAPTIGCYCVWVYLVAKAFDQLESKRE